VFKSMQRACTVNEVRLRSELLRQMVAETPLDRFEEFVRTMSKVL
jgi:hypothetical protein